MDCRSLCPLCHLGTERNSGLHVSSFDKTGTIGWTTHESIIISQVTLRSHNMDSDYYLLSEEWNTVQITHKNVFFCLYGNLLCCRYSLGTYLHKYRSYNKHASLLSPYHCDNHQNTPVTSVLRTSGFDGLEVACWPLVPNFTGSNPAKAARFLRVNKTPQHIGGHGCLSIVIVVCCQVEVSATK